MGSYHITQGAQAGSLWRAGGYTGRGDGASTRRGTCRREASSIISDSVTLRTVARQAPLSMGFSGQEYLSGLPCPPSGICPTQGSNLYLLYLLHWGHLGSPQKEGLYVYKHVGLVLRSRNKHSFVSIIFPLKNLKKWKEYATQKSVLCLTLPSTSESLRSPRPPYTYSFISQVSTCHLFGQPIHTDLPKGACTFYLASVLFSHHTFLQVQPIILSYLSSLTVQCSSSVNY